MLICHMGAPFPRRLPASGLAPAPSLRLLNELGSVHYSAKARFSTAKWTGVVFFVFRSDRHSTCSELIVDSESGIVFFLASFALQT